MLLYLFLRKQYLLDSARASDEEISERREQESAREGERAKEGAREREI